MQLARISTVLKTAYRGSDMARRVHHLNSWIDRAPAEGASDNGYDHAETVKDFYDLCGEFMEFGWGESLHFAPLSPGESLEESKTRHQRLMISKLDLQQGMNVVDVGCGIGGPMRRVVREAGVKVVGVNNNEMQLDRARSLNAEAGLEHMVDYVACDFMDMAAIPDNTFDRGYAIESTCHAPDRAGAFAEIYRVLKPGALFWGQEMCMTDIFDPDDNRHRAIKQNLRHTIALRDIATFGEVDEALESVGFHIIEGSDMAVEKSGTSTPWYQPMETRVRKAGLTTGLLRMPPLRKVLIQSSRIAVALNALPRGSADVLRLMDWGAHSLVAGGKAGVFTPLYCFLARKPA